jgi:predicted Zn-dependent protease
MAWEFAWRPPRAFAAPLGAALALAFVLTALVLISTQWSRVAGRLSTRPEAVAAPALSASDWFQRGGLELHRHRLRAAEEAFRHAKQLDPTLAQPRWGLVCVHAVRMRRAQALAELAELAESHPIDFEQALLWTQIRCSHWDVEKVTPQLQECLDSDPAERWVRLALAEGLRQLGRSAEAAEVLAVLEESDPEVQALRARLAIDRGDLSVAEAILSRQPPDHVELAEIRGQLALARRDGPTAVAQFQRALVTNPDNRRCLNGLAQALRFSGQNIEAEPILQAVHRHDVLINLIRRAAELRERQDPDLIKALGVACEALQFVAEARAWYRLALSIDPIDSETQIALYRLGPGATISPSPEPR